MFYQFERHGEAVNCVTCGDSLFKGGLAIGPIVNPDGSAFEGTSVQSLSVRCSNGHESPIDLGIGGRCHPQPGPPSLEMSGIIAR